MPKKDKTKVIERVEDNVCDLSLSELNEVPVSQIASFKRVTILDLSSNRLTTLGKNFVTLTRLVKLDLSKNQLKYLPEEFGLLHNLRHLDLYDNKLEHLPLSFGELINLRYLDLKGNPLVPALVRIVGFCSTTKECQDSARNTVKFMASMQIEADKIKDRIQQQQDQLDQQQQQQEGEEATTNLGEEKFLNEQIKSNSDYNQNMNENQNQINMIHQQQQQQQQQKSKRSTKKNKTKLTNNNKNSNNQTNSSTISKAVQTIPVEISSSSNNGNSTTMKIQRSKRNAVLQSTALSSIMIFFILLILNVFIIYLVMFKHPEIVEFIINIIPQQYRNWLVEKTEFFRLHVTDWISNVVTTPDEN